VVVLVTRDEHDPASKLRYEKTLSNIQEVTARAGRVIAVATEGDTTIGTLVEHVIHIPPVIELLSPLVEIVPLQLLAYYWPITSPFAAAATWTSPETWPSR
jgi:glucosamine--fructose-6-phosphate aminotransferase (isomerizing)